MVACFAMGKDALLTWDDVFDSRQKRHESGIREHGLLQAGSPSVVVRKVLQAREIQVDNCGSFEGVPERTGCACQSQQTSTKASWTFVNTSASSKGLAPAVHPQRLS